MSELLYYTIVAYCISIIIYAIRYLSAHPVQPNSWENKLCTWLEKRVRYNYHMVGAIILVLLSSPILLLGDGVRHCKNAITWLTEEYENER